MTREFLDHAQPASLGAHDGYGSDISLLDLMHPLAKRCWLLLGWPLAAAALALGVSFLVPPTYTARTTFIPPQQQSAASTALASLGALSGLAGAAAGLKSPSDQYLSLLQSNAVIDQLIKQFDLVRVYDVDLLEEARRKLRDRVRASVGKKDNLIAVEIDDINAERAAAMANQHVEELRKLTNRLAITEAQQRRAFFEAQLAQTRDRLAKAQTEVQASGISEASLRAEPKSAAEGYARLRAESTAVEVRLGVLRQTLSESSPEILGQLAALRELRAQVARMEAVADSRPSPGAAYVDKYREFKYQETLFELFARQYELARVDESREGALIQVLDAATPPQLPSKPKRPLIAVLAAMGTLAVLAIYLVAQHMWQLQKRNRSLSDWQEPSSVNADLTSPPKSG